MAQFHFDPATYDALMAEEVPGYPRLQAEVVAATDTGRPVRRVLDLGTGTGATATRVLGGPSRSSTCGHRRERFDAGGGPRRPAGRRRARRAALAGPAAPGPFDLVVSALAVHHLDRDQKADLFVRVAAVLGPGGRFVLGDLVVPDDPADVVTPIDGEFDRPDPAADQRAWMEAAGFDARIVWVERDLTVLVADRRGE